MNRQISRFTSPRPSPTRSGGLEGLRWNAAAIEDVQCGIDVTLSPAQRKRQVPRQEHVDTQPAQTPQAPNVGLKIAVVGVLKENPAPVEDEIARKEDPETAAVHEEGVVPAAVAGRLQHLERQIADSDLRSVDDLRIDSRRFQDILAGIDAGSLAHVEANTLLVPIAEISG